jgi:hypothetical protein
MTTDTRTRAHDLDWHRSASGLAIRTVWYGFHLSIWRRPQGGPYHFTVSGTLPASISTTGEAIGFVWDRLLSRIGRGAAA